MVKVVKFGGSSLADAGQFKKVADIIHADSTRRFVVPSAPGKRNPSDTKVTDMLYQCYDLASKGQDFDELFLAIMARFHDIIAKLGLHLSLVSEFEKIKLSFLGRAGRDYAASRGEYLSGIVLAAYLGFEFIDAAEVVFFDECGVFDAKRTNDALAKRLHGTKSAVIPGFYGSMPNDTVKTFSRGGSDFTGSIVARAIGADLYENWTDVSGFLMADPRIVDSPDVISTITYRELRELSYMGATVLHEDAIFPVRSVGIPINIKNTNAPQDPGTMIVSDAPAQCTITGIAGKRGFSVINIEKDMMNSELGFGRRVLEVLENHRISFEHLPSGIDTMSIIVNTACIEGREDALVSDIRTVSHADFVEIEKGLALLAIVGRGMRSMRGTAARVCAALAHANINIRMIDQGSSELNIIVGVEEHDFEQAMRCIYAIFTC